MKSTPEDFLGRLTARFPQSQPKLKTFPSGAYMIDLTIKDEVHVIEYLPTLGFGVSRQKTAVFGWEGVEHSFSLEEDVEAFVGTLSVSDPEK